MDFHNNFFIVLRASVYAAKYLLLLYNGDVLEVYSGAYPPADAEGDVLSFLQELGSLLHLQSYCIQTNIRPPNLR